MADRFPGPYRNSVPQDLDKPDPMVVRVPATHAGIGARRSVLGKAYSDKSGPQKTIRHAPNLINK